MMFIAAFRARNQAMRFGQVLGQNGICYRTINTPQRLGIGCGLSIVVSPSEVKTAASLLASVSWSAFAGWFSEENGVYSRVFL